MAKTREFLIVCSVVVLSGIAWPKDWWDKKQYTEWTAKEAARMLNDSPWGKIHIITIMNPTFTGTKSFATIGSGDLEREKRNLFHLHFLTAKPIRMAIARNAMLQSRDNIERERLRKTVEQSSGQSIVIGMTLSSDPPGTSSISGYLSALLKLTTPALTANTTLATDTGKKVFLSRYDPPGKDGLGAKYYFPRTLPNGAPLVTPADKEIRFETVVTLNEGATLTGDKLGVEKEREDRIWMQFDLRKMIFEGKLEI